MPWLLYRYILADLLRVILLTTAVLVTVIAFGATLKPLARGGLDAVQTAKYLCLAIVPMLQFALPFAAGFGSTLSFYRLTTDNEIQAMAAGGISYRRILLPVAALGIVLTLLMVLLTQSIIPRFWAIIAQTVTEDVTKLFQASVERGEPFVIGDTQKMQIFANRVVVDHPTEVGGPQTRMILFKVAAAELDPAGRIVTDVTASRAIVDVYQREDRTFLKMVMEDTVALNARTGHLVHSDRIIPQAILVPNAIAGTTKGLTRSQLLALRTHPDGYEPVMKARGALADAMGALELRDAIDSQLQQRGFLDLLDESPGFAKPRHYTVQAQQMHSNGAFVVPRGKKLQITQYEGDQPSIRFTAEAAQLAPAASGAFAGSLFDLVIENHEVVNLHDPTGAVNQRRRLIIPSLRVSGHDQAAVSALPSIQLLDRARTKAPDRLAGPISWLESQLRSMNNEIIGRLFNRYAISCTAILLLILGATMAMWHRNSLPLATYLWAFLPAIGDLIVISAGEQLLRDGRPLGYFIMWSGNTVLLILFFFSYWRVSRN